MQAKIEATTADLRVKVDELSAKVDEAIAQGKEKLAKKAPKGEEAPAEEASAEV